MSSPSTLTSPLPFASPTTRLHPPSSPSSSSLPSSSLPPSQSPRDPLLPRTHLGPTPTNPSSLRPPAHQHKSESSHTDALWAEMQATLAEVELSASRGTHFFGPAHAAALEELRVAQVGLAQAWARGEGVGEVVEDRGGRGIVGGKMGGMGGKSKSEDSSERSPTASLGEGREGGTGGVGAQVEAERDLEVARRRKEANGRYFERVGRGVVDVVGRLEEVAGAMGRVERESREVWSEESSLESGLGAEGGRG